MSNSGTQMLETAQHLISSVGKQLHLSDTAIQKLIKPDHIHEADLEVTMDDGSMRTFKAYRVQHNNVLGPYKGGILYHPLVSRYELQALATLMIIKCSVS